VIQAARQRGLKANQVRSAFVGVDVVSEGENLFLIAVVVLHRDFKIDAVTYTLEIDHLVMQNRFVLIEMLNEGDDSTGVLELVLLFGFLGFDRDQNAFIQECEFAKALRKNIETVFRGFKNLYIGLERHFGAAAIRMTGDFELRLRYPALVVL